MPHQKLISISKMKLAFRGKAKCLCLIRANKLQFQMRWKELDLQKTLPFLFWIARIQALLKQENKSQLSLFSTLCLSLIHKAIFVDLTDFQISSLRPQQSEKHNLSNSEKVQTLLIAWQILKGQKACGTSGNLEKKPKKAIVGILWSIYLVSNIRAYKN